MLLNSIRCHSSLIVLVQFFSSFAHSSDTIRNDSVIFNTSNSVSSYRTKNNFPNFAFTLKPSNVMLNQHAFNTVVHANGVYSRNNSNTSGHKPVSFPVTAKKNYHPVRKLINNVNYFPHPQRNKNPHMFNRKPYLHPIALSVSHICLNMPKSSSHFHFSVQILHAIIPFVHKRTVKVFKY